MLTSFALRRGTVGKRSTLYARLVLLSALGLATACGEEDDGTAKTETAAESSDDDASNGSADDASADDDTSADDDGSSAEDDNTSADDDDATTDESNDDDGNTSADDDGSNADDDNTSADDDSDDDDDGSSADDGSNADDAADDDSSTGSDDTSEDDSSDDGSVDDDVADDDSAGECPRPESDYTLFGEDCALADFDCASYFQDECGCGCDDLNAPKCRSEDEYVALGDMCDVIRYACDDGERAFNDACGCGCEPEMAGGECSAPNKRYVLHDTGSCTLALYACEEGEQPFFDDCGCGCEPESDSTPPDSCETPSGSELTIAADDVRTLQCFQVMVQSQIVRSAEELDAALESCDGPSSSSFDVDWDSQLVFLAMVPEHPDAGLGTLTLTDEGVVVGIEAPAYCGGAAPATGIVAVELPATYDDVIQQTCYVGTCGDGPLPPSTPPDHG